MRAPELNALIDHLPVARRPGDLDAAVLEVGGNRRDLPVALAHRPGLLEEVGELARRDPLLPRGAREEKLFAPPAELALERGDELDRFRREHPGLVRAVESDTRRRSRGAHAVFEPASNWASSVEPLSASVELSPPETASSTASK